MLFQSNFKIIKGNRVMNIAIIGSRNCGDLTVEKIIQNIPEQCTCIISGGAMGVDSLAKTAARQLKIPIQEYLPDYAVFGRKAPIYRNYSIINHADQVLAFWDYQSRGTQHVILECLKIKKPIKIININDDDSSIF